jgi:hypothetical protein
MFLSVAEMYADLDRVAAGLMATVARNIYVQSGHGYRRQMDKAERLLATLRGDAEVLTADRQEGL